MALAQRSHEHSLPIHSRVFRVYLDYLTYKLLWPKEKIVDLLSELGTDLDRIGSDSTWYSLDFTDRFYEHLVQKTNDPNIAFHAGEFIHSKNFSPLIHQLASAVMKVSTFYKLLARFTTYFTKASMWRVIETGDDYADIESYPIIPNGDRKYICENRRGILTGVPLIFGLPPAEVKESQCFHQGARSCRYQVKWKENTQLLSYTLICLISVSIGSVAYLKLGLEASLIFGLSSLFVGLLWRNQKFTKAQYKELLRQNQFLDESAKKIERKSIELNLIGQIAKLTHAMMSPVELGKLIVKSVVEIMEYDRALLLTVDQSRQVLKVDSFFGFDSKMGDLLGQTEFNLDSDNTAGFFVRVVNTKLPVLISDVSSGLQNLSPRSQKFAKMLGAKSFVAVPLRNQDGSVRGVLAVDYVTPGKAMNIGDQDLLMTLADHLAIALQNARVMDELERNLHISKAYSDQQQNLRLAFQKFVPSELAQDAMAGSSEEIVTRLLRQVDKKPAAIMFGDIVGFSAIASSLNAEEVIDLINTTFNRLEPIVRKYHGFVDKFTGDGFMAVFEDPQACLKACNAAYAMVEEMGHVNVELAKKKYPQISFGFGINYGQVILGNIGSTDRLNFTVLGEAVNLASRLESYTRNLGPNTICVSAPVFHQANALANDRLVWKNHPQVTVKGYSEPISIYELRAKTNQINSNSNPTRGPS